ncbi:uncharacterized protein LOC107203713 [Parus major]|uniref:uncharacterized protein LOC107203713 n=1 Tax=Parus major TaxID=9157 RepID=UPI000771011F|nr:uncharacterized protein LOC107203713 [Parus major]
MDANERDQSSAGQGWEPWGALGGGTPLRGVPLPAFGILLLGLWSSAGSVVPRVPVGQGQAEPAALGGAQRSGMHLLPGLGGCWENKTPGNFLEVPRESRDLGIFCPPSSPLLPRSHSAPEVTNGFKKTTAHTKLFPSPGVLVMIPHPEGTGNETSAWERLCQALPAAPAPRQEQRGSGSTGASFPGQEFRPFPAPAAPGGAGPSRAPGDVRGTPSFSLHGGCFRTSTEGFSHKLVDDDVSWNSIAATPEEEEEEEDEGDMRARNKAAPAEHDAGCAGMLRGSEGSLNHRHLKVGVRDWGWEKGRTSHVLPGVRCSEPAGCESGSSDPFCAFKDGAGSDGEKRRGRWERRGIQPGGSELEPRLRDAVRDSSFLEKLLEEHPWWDPMEMEKPQPRNA